MSVKKQSLMENSNLSPKQHRWLAISLLLIVGLFLLALIIIPLIDKSLKLSEQLSNLTFKMQQYERILQKKNVVFASMEKIRQQQQTQGYVNSQQTAALASAEMQEFIKKTIVEAGGQLSSAQAIPANADPNTSAENKFDRIVVRIRMTGNSEVLRKVLFTIETSTPFIVIDQIDIRPMRGRMNMTSHQLEASNELNVNFQAVSFMRKPTQ
jgi:general secretion pathway protein M